MKSFKERVQNSPLLFTLATLLLKIKTRLTGNVKTYNHGKGHFKKDIIGGNCVISIGKGTTIHGSSIVYVRGNNNKLIIGENCKIRKNCSFWLCGDNCSIILGNGVTMQHTNHFNVNEDGRQIVIGNDCMFSNNIIVRTSDDHGIFDMITSQRLNEAKDVIIGNHVWVAPHSRIMKGVVIEEGSVIGSNTMVTKHIPANVLAVGMPARIVKENIVWSRLPDKIV